MYLPKEHKGEHQSSCLARESKVADNSEVAGNVETDDAPEVGCTYHKRDEEASDNGGDASRSDRIEHSKLYIGPVKSHDENEKQEGQDECGMQCLFWFFYNSNDILLDLVYSLVHDHISRELVGSGIIQPIVSVCL